MINMDVPRMVCIDISIQIINFTTINHHTEQQILRTKYIYIYRERESKYQRRIHPCFIIYIIYIYMYVYIYIYIYMYIYIFVYIYIYIYIYILDIYQFCYKILRMFGEILAKKNILRFAFTSIHLDIFLTNFDCSGVLNTSGGGDGD